MLEFAPPVSPESAERAYLSRTIHTQGAPAQAVIHRKNSADSPGGWTFYGISLPRPRPSAKRTVPGSQGAPQDLRHVKLRSLEQSTPSRVAHQAPKGQVPEQAQARAHRFGRCTCSQGWVLFGRCGRARSLFGELTPSFSTASGTPDAFRALPAQAAWGVFVPSVYPPGMMY